jgi:hypothetical protein
VSEPVAEDASRESGDGQQRGVATERVVPASERTHRQLHEELKNFGRKWIDTAWASIYAAQIINNGPG